MPLPSHTVLSSGPLLRLASANENFVRFTMSQSLSFQSTTFDVVDRSGEPWIRGPQIGAALGYPDLGKAIKKLYARHADEFTPAMTAVITLPTEGGPQETRIFSLRGCHLLAMFARTPVAKQFRVWVLDVLDKLNAQRVDRIDTTSPKRKPLPQNTAGVSEIESHLAAIRAFARELADRERSLHFVLRDTLPPLRGVTRPLALRLYDSLDASALLMDNAMKQLECTARLVLECAHGRMM